MSPHTYSRKGEEGHPDHAERGGQQASVPGLRNLITITYGGESDLVTRQNKGHYVIFSSVVQVMGQTGDKMIKVTEWYL